MKFFALIILSIATVVLAFIYATLNWALIITGLVVILWLIGPHLARRCQPLEAGGYYEKTEYE